MQEIQWHYGSNVRNGQLQNVTKVHLWEGEGQTLCGRRPRARRWWLTPEGSDRRCIVCTNKVNR